MGKLIIENQSSLSDIEAISFVKKIMESGRISNEGKQYCYHVSFVVGIGVASYLNKKSDRFVVFDEE